MSVGRIERQWRSYRAGVLSINAPAVQVIESRRAFYAGAEALRHEFYMTSNDPRTQEAELAALLDELDQFVQAVKAGVA